MLPCREEYQSYQTRKLHHLRLKYTLRRRYHFESEPRNNADMGTGRPYTLALFSDEGADPKDTVYVVFVQNSNTMSSKLQL